MCCWGGGGIVFYVFTAVAYFVWLRCFELAYLVIWLYIFKMEEYTTVWGMFWYSVRHFPVKLCSNEICVKSLLTRSIVEYGTGAFCDLWNWSIIPNPSLVVVFKSSKGVMVKCLMGYQTDPNFFIRFLWFTFSQKIIVDKDNTLFLSNGRRMTHWRGVCYLTSLRQRQKVVWDTALVFML